MSDIPADIMKTANDLAGGRLIRFAMARLLNEERQSSAALIKELMEALEGITDKALLGMSYGLSADLICEDIADVARAALAKAKELS